MSKAFEDAKRAVLARCAEDAACEPCDQYADQLVQAEMENRTNRPIISTERKP